MRAESPRLSFNAIWAAVTLVILGGWVFWATHWSETGWDFTMFYVAAHTPAASIHDQTVFQATARRVLAGTGVTYASPYVRPAVFTLALRWMRGLSYWEAYRIWACLEFAFYAVTLWALSRRFRARVLGFYPWALFFPAFFGMIQGQDSLAMGLVLCLALVLLAGGRDAVGGALLSLTLYKFNLFLLVPVYLALRKRYRALAWYALCGAALAGASALLERPSLYLALLPEIQRYTIGFSPKSMLGLRGLCAALGWSAAYPAAAIVLAAYLLGMSRRMDFVRGFGLTVAACVLCAYHGTWYDGAVLALPFGLALAEGGPDLRMTTACVMVIPFWNAMPAFVTVLLLGFAILYSVTLAGSRPEALPARPEI
jgi:hypothetical protein